MHSKLSLFGKILFFAFCLNFHQSIDAQSVSAGSLHSLFLCSDSIPRACGTNVSGQLGIGNTFSYRVNPTPITTLSSIKEISAANNFSLFLKSDGTVWACGDNQSGQLATGNLSTQFIPVQSPFLSDIMAISAGAAHSLFLKNDGTVWGCGDNQNGQLGDGTTTSTSTPVQVMSLTDIVAISAGQMQSLFLKNDGTVYVSWGPSAPTLIAGLTNVTKISIGSSQSLFLKDDGTVMSLGGNSYGELGDGTTNNSSTPVAVTVLSDIIDIKAGLMSNSFFLKNDGTVWMCGINNAGQFGIGTNTGFDPNPTPSQNPNLSGIVALTSGWYHSIFVKNDETAQSAGGNSQGQLGNGSTVNSFSLVQVNNMCAVASIGEEMEMISGSVLVYPNPGNGIFSLRANEHIEQVSVFNIQGELVFSSPINSMDFSLDLSIQPKGMYLLQVSNSGKTVQQKIVIH